jgi:phosphate transport system permease protein
MASFSSRRRAGNAAFLAFSYAAAALGLAVLFIILASLLWSGVSGLSPAVFSESTPPPPGEGGGLINAIYGSLVMTVLGLAIGAPLGLLAGTYMAEHGRFSKLAGVVRFINDILLSAPSIIIGLFIYQLVITNIHHSSGFAGALALAMLVIPVVTRTTEDMLLLVPNTLREAASAMGLPRSHVILKVAYQAARPGLITGLLLAFARISGETAPLLFTAGQSLSFNWDISHDTANLPTIIFQFATSPYKGWQQLAWTGALIITAAVLVLSIAARFLGSTRTAR